VEALDQHDGEQPRRAIRKITASSNKVATLSHNRIESPNWAASPHTVFARRNALRGRLTSQMVSLVGRVVHIEGYPVVRHHSQLPNVQG
jgi:hypothetical protein